MNIWQLPKNGGAQNRSQNTIILACYRDAPKSFGVCLGYAPGHFSGMFRSTEGFGALGFRVQSVGLGPRVLKIGASSTNETGPSYSLHQGCFLNTQVSFKRFNYCSVCTLSLRWPSPFWGSDSLVA